MGKAGGAAKHVLAFIWTFAPIYSVEKLADYYFLTDNTTSFYFMSGWRLILFIVFVLCGSLAAGALLRQAWRAAATQWAAVAAALILFFWACDPRVCFSSGPDGLEPLRLGFFLGSVAFSGTALGAGRLRGEIGDSASLTAGFLGLAALGFYPVVFTFAGTKVLPPLHPWASAAILGVAAFAVTASTCVKFGPVKGFLLPLASMGALLLVSLGIAAAYFQTVAWGVGVLTMSVTAAALAGVLFATRGRRLAAAHRAQFSSLFAVGIALVLMMMLFSTPDAVNGVVPAAGSSATSFVQGIPVYAGAYMAGPAGHAQGAGITVSFTGTNASVIQQDNYLSAGIGIHAAGCCVDGVDYSYRYDLFLFHSGDESMVASAWEACDDNAACGGHPWKVLMFMDAMQFGQGHVEDNVTLRMVWTQGSGGAEVVWSYSMPGLGSFDFTGFTVPAAENHDFNTGVLAGGPPNSIQKASYFFQFGIMSSYPIGQGGWRVRLSCPSLLEGTWGCVDHAMTLSGGDSFWKYFWRWGEDYKGVSIISPRTGEVTFAYAGANAPSFLPLW